LGREEIERARAVGLVEYLRRQEPENLRRTGRDSYCLSDHDSLKISGNGKSQSRLFLRKS